MALQGSGQIKISEIATEFGGTAPHGLSEYYGSDTGVPTSGEITCSDFYGTSSVTPVDITFGGQYNTEDNASSYTWTSAPIGTATSDRKVIICVASTGNNAVAVTGCTIDGVAATQEMYTYSTEPDNRSQLVFYSRTVTSGSFVNVTVTLNGSQDRFGMMSYSVYNSTGTNATANDTVDSSGLLSATCNVPDNGAMIGFAFNQEAGGTWTWTELTEDADVSIGGGTSTMSGSHKEYTTGGSKTVTAQCGDTSPLRQVLGLISFNP